MTILLDDTSSPSVRETIGQLLGAASFADLAVAHVRLAAVDLQPHELAGLQRLRLLLARFDAAFAADAHALSMAPGSADQLLRLLAFVESGRVEIRSTGVALWLPDFSLFHGVGPTANNALLLGAHYFRQLFNSNGTPLTCVVREAAAIERAAGRFELLWERAHDIRPVIADTLREALVVRPRNPLRIESADAPAGQGATTKE